MADPAPEPSATDRPPTAETVDPARSFRTTLRGLATIVAPTSLVTSLLYYFGWERANRQSDVMGFHVGLLEYSTQDYILQSLPSLFVPLLFGLLASIAGLLLHGGLLLYATRATPDLDAEEREQRRANVRRLAKGVAGLGVVLLLLGIAGAIADAPPRAVAIAFPLCLNGGIVCAGYAVYLSQRFRPQDKARRLTPELRGVQTGLSTLMVLLLLLTLFWSVSNYAQIRGADLAHYIQDEQFEALHDVTLYSAKRLFLGHPVVETPLPGDEGGAYRFRYTGLKLMVRTKNSYWLRPSDDTVSRANIFLAASPDLRFEFARAR